MRRSGFYKRKTLNAIIALAFFLLSACGGGGGSVAGGGIGGTGVIASGAVTDIGSVHVNGAVYNTHTATFSIDNSPGTEADIRRGMVIRVDGTRDTVTTGTARTVAYEDVVKGPVTNVAISSQVTTLTVLGQTVIVEQDVTYIDDNVGGTTLTLPTFTNGDEIEVSGLRETIFGGSSAVNGPIRATYIDIKETLLSEYEVKGVIEDDPTNTYNFKISGLGIDFGGAIPMAGELVEVKGLAANFTAPDELVASSIETRTTGLGETEIDHAEIEGFINNLNTGAETLELEGQVIDYSAASFEGGVSGDLNNGTKIEAEGSITGSVLVADKIEFKESIRVEGNAADNDADGSFALVGLGGLTIFVDPAITEYEGFSNVSAGDHIEIRGRQASGTGNILATEIKDRGAADPRVEFQAPVTAIDSTPGSDNVALMDTITVDTTDNPTPFTFFDFNDNPISRTNFYNNLATGDLVKAKGDLIAGPSVDWKELEQED